MYAKLINGVLEYAPSSVVKDNIGYSNYNCNSNDAMLREDGYKPVLVGEMPNEMKLPQLQYEETENSINGFYVETYVEPTYFEERAAHYPDFREYLDAQVKINSGDYTLIVEGKEQLANYYQKCLDVKKAYPKR